MADLRAGYLLAPPIISQLLAKTVNPFILSSSVRQACAAALQAPAHPTAHAADFAAAKRALRALTGGSLVMAETDDRTPILMMRSRTAEDLQRAFLQQGVLTVSGREFATLDARCVRISIPKAADAKRLIEAAAQLDR